jgi:hypothetical protein
MEADRRDFQICLNILRDEHPVSVTASGTAVGSPLARTLSKPEGRVDGEHLRGDGGDEARRMLQ